MNCTMAITPHAALNARMRLQAMPIGSANTAMIVENAMIENIPSGMFLMIVWTCDRSYVRWTISNVGRMVAGNAESMPERPGPSNVGTAVIARIHDAAMVARSRSV